MSPSLVLSDTFLRFFGVLTQDAAGPVSCGLVIAKKTYKASPLFLENHCPTVPTGAINLYSSAQRYLVFPVIHNLQQVHSQSNQGRMADDDLVILLAQTKHAEAEYQR
jgi:hypothetical protein